MPCYKPLDAFWKVGGGITFSHRNSNGNKLQLPCGQCIGCRLDHSIQWTTRILHESIFHRDNCFLTLTYNDENLPPSQSISKREVQLFLKRLRKHLHPRKIRYYACGEYGGQTLRPHYHLIVFGYYPDDLKPFKEGSRRGTSKTIENLWGLGFIQVGPVDVETAKYTAGYVTKKIKGPKAPEHYLRVHRDTGEIVSVLPEFAVMSRNPGLGAKYMETYGKQVLDYDYIVTGGVKVKIPRYYDKIIERYDPRLLEDKKQERRKRAKLHADDQTPERLAVREECAKAKRAYKKRAN